MAWILTIDIDADGVDAVSDQLWTLGTTGVAEVPGEGATRLLAGFDTESAAEAAAAELGGSVAPVDPSSWAGPEVSTIEVAGRTLTIDAGQSFGHGAHPTTQLCLRALESHLVAGQTVLDVGCGSGVLSLAAMTLGASSATAIDIDPAAVEATQANAATNQLDVKVSSTPIEDVAGPFDVVVVNMLLADLEPIAPQVQRAAGRLIILSGALIEQAHRWSDMFPGCISIDERFDGDWAGRVIQINE